jgi:enoyl-CoA hydratase/carnithine racemase
VVAAPGVALNSGAALLSACSFPLATESLKFGFNEVNYGFVPHSGASYYMSRMPGEFGTFMAVTGLSIGGADSSLIGGITNGMIEKTKYYDEHVASIVDSMEL